MRYVAPDLLATEWPSVREGLLKVLEKTSDTWLPEDIYHGILQGNSHLFLIEQGFAVVQFNAPTMFVWALYFPEGHRKETIIPVLDQLATESKCKRIRFHSPRKAWAVFLEGAFTPIATVFERRL